MLDSIHQIYPFKLTTKNLSKIIPITIIIIFILPFATAQEFNPIEQAQELIDSGKAEEALKLLRPLQPQFEGVPAFDYVFGIACIDTGRNVEAIFALERVVDNLPEHGPARAELAKAYLALGETDDAKTQFEKVKALPDTPPEAQQTIERYLSGIELFHDRTRLTFRPWVKLGLGIDTNINGATNEKTLFIPSLPNIPFALGGTENSSVLNLGAGLSVSKPLSKEKGTSLFSSVELNDRITLEHNEFRGTMISGRAGARIQKQKYNLSVAADSSAFKIQGSGATAGDRLSAGFTSEFQYAITENDQISTFLQASLVRYPEQSVRDVDKYMSGITYGHLFSKVNFTPVLISSIFGGIENERANSGADHFGRNMFGSKIGLGLQLSKKQTVSAALTYQRSLYTSADPTFLVHRRDTFFDFNLTYRYQVNKNLSITPTAIYNNNSSNILLNDFDRFEFMVTARFDI